MRQVSRGRFTKEKGRGDTEAAFLSVEEGKKGREGGGTRPFSGAVAHAQ